MLGNKSTINLRNLHAIVVSPPQIHRSRNVIRQNRLEFEFPVQYADSSLIFSLDVELIVWDIVGFGFFSVLFWTPTPGPAAVAFVIAHYADRISGVNQAGD